MKILLIADNPDMKELLTFQIASKFNVQITECFSARDAVEKLKADPKICNLIVGPFNGATSVLVTHLKFTKGSPPVLFFFDPLVVKKPEAGEHKGIEIVGFVDQSRLIDGLLYAIQSYINMKESGLTELSEFCPVRTNLLIRVSPLKSDIYMRLSEKKFVKLFNLGDDFNTADLDRYYKTRKVEYMYLRRSDTEDFVKKFRGELEAILLKNDISKEELMASSEMAQDAIYELVHAIGFTQEVQEIAKRNVEITLKSIGSNPRLVDLIGKIVDGGHYISRHSTLLAHVACCVAKEMEWGSEGTFSKLVLAAYMHDISVTNPEIAKMTTLRELEAKKDSFPDHDVKAYHLHPAKSADIVRSFSEVPADVDIIVQQHHERPNGSGFPRGLLFNYIAPLSSLFIVAHDLTQNILDKREKFSLPVYLAENKRQLNKGNFKRVISALEKVKI